VPSSFRSRILSIFVVTAGGLLALAPATPAAAGLSLSSTFNSGAEGWKVIQNFPADNTATDPTFLPSGGQPGGAIEFSDADFGDPFGDPAGNDFLTGAFASPGSWSGDASNNYGGTFSFDLKSNVNGDTGPIVDFYAGEKPSGATPDFSRTVCIYFNGTPSTTNYQTYTTTLNEAHLGTAGSLCADPASPAQVADVLSNFGGVLLNVDDSYAMGETETIDNVSLSGGGPLPGQDVSRTLTIDFSKKKGGFFGKLKAPDLAACAAGQSVKVYKQVSGPDKKLGTDKTSSKGAYLVKAKGKPGKYYAKAGQSTADGDTCLAAKSETVHLV
jgi:hypothetical protein